jgi:RimJ/RimL family protein N-acetyltransferase
MTNASIELRQRGVSDNYPGFAHPLTFCPIRAKDKPAIMKAIWSSHKELSQYFNWASYARSWNGSDMSKFVDNLINDPLPNQHFAFFIGDEIVGVGSLVECYTIFDQQVALWVNSKYHGLGIGTRIVETLTDVAFRIWGINVLYYCHDSSNESSKRLPQKCGFLFSHTEDKKKIALKETGLWYAWFKYRPNDLPPGILQGRDIDDFTNP